MIKQTDDPRKEPARKRAERKWRNHAVEKSFKAAQKEASEEAAKQPKPIEPADVIHQEKLIAEGTTLFERKFLKDIRAMLEGHQTQNLARYAISIQIKRKKLLQEKLRRLQLAAQNQGEQCLM